jgi:hypothetical protein
VIPLLVEITQLISSATELLALSDKDVASLEELGKATGTCEKWKLHFGIDDMIVTKLM